MLLIKTENIFKTNFIFLILRFRIVIEQNQEQVAKEIFMDLVINGIEQKSNKIKRFRAK